MFTGRVVKVGCVETMAAGRLVVRAPGSATALRAGGSVCVDGVRLTVHEAGPADFASA